MLYWNLSYNFAAEVVKNAISSWTIVICDSNIVHFCDYMQEMDKNNKLLKWSHSQNTTSLVSIPRPGGGGPYIFDHSCGPEGIRKVP